MSVVKVTKENFEEIKNDSRPVLLDFYADWCGPCQMIGPIVAEIAEENPQYLVGKVNVDEEPELAAAFSIVSIPFLAVLKEGKIAGSAVGYRPKDAILALIKG